MSMGFEGDSTFVDQSFRKTDITSKDSSGKSLGTHSDVYLQSDSKRQSLIFDPDIDIDRQNYESIVNTEGARDSQVDYLINNKGSLYSS